MLVKNAPFELFKYGKIRTYVENFIQKFGGQDCLGEDVQLQLYQNVNHTTLSAKLFN